jgi:hypothetical protein
MYKRREYKLLHGDGSDSSSSDSEADGREQPEGARLSGWFVRRVRRVLTCGNAASGSGSESDGGQDTFVARTHGRLGVHLCARAYWHTQLTRTRATQRAWRTSPTRRTRTRMKTRMSKPLGRPGSAPYARRCASARRVPFLGSPPMPGARAAPPLRAAGAAADGGDHGAAHAVKGVCASAQALATRRSSAAAT